MGTAKLPILIVPSITIIGFWLASLRWRLILAGNKIKFSGWRAFRGYLLGLFYGFFLPGVLSGDAVRIVICIKRTNSLIGTATAAVLLERVSGLLALLCIAFIIYSIFPEISSVLLTIEDAQLLGMLSVAGVIGIVILLLSRHIWMRFLPQENSKGPFNFLRAAILTLCNLRGQTLGLVLILSAMFQAINIVAVFLLSRAMNLGLPVVVFFAVVPIVYLATVIPISLGGIGVREATLVYFLSRFGVMTTDAITLSFLIYLNLMFVGSIGGCLQLIETLFFKLDKQQD
jgi:uncharacterized membrane protein YbhN (UPF0104 family)